MNVIVAKKPFKHKYGDLVCGFENVESEKYLETTSSKKPEGQVLPLCLIDPNPWHALSRLKINVDPIKVPYECPYTGYSFYSIIPSALISKDLEKNWGELIRTGRIACCSVDYVLDWEYHKSTFQERMFDLSEIEELLMGSGYTCGTRMNDGSHSKGSTIVNLDNGDMLWVHFWIWHNK